MKWIVLYKRDIQRRWKRRVYRLKACRKWTSQLHKHHQRTCWKPRFVTPDLLHQKLGGVDGDF